MKLDLEALKNATAVADGAWATQLRARGFPPQKPVEVANLEFPELVATLAREYAAAGAKFLTTNTFSANRFPLERRGLQKELKAINRAGVELARQAAADRAVAGTMGPSGKILAVREAAEDELARAFAEQAEILADAGADLLLLETFSEPAEILLAVRTVKAATGLPVIASMSFDSGPQRTHTLMGAEAGECAAALQDAGADLIGCNCGAGIAYFLPAVFAMRSAMDRPLWIKPSAGLPDLEDGRPVYRQTPEEFAAFIPALLDAGANLVGGCCGTGPEHIKRVAAIVEHRKHPPRRGVK